MSIASSHTSPPVVAKYCLTWVVLNLPQVKTPVLLMLGEEDKRVPNKQGIEYYRALKARQLPVQ